MTAAVCFCNNVIADDAQSFILLDNIEYVVMKTVIDDIEEGEFIATVHVLTECYECRRVELHVFT